jgi:hypothetical protein
MEAAKFFSKLELEDHDASWIFKFHIEAKLAFVKQTRKKRGGMESDACQQPFDLASDAIPERELRKAFVQVYHS